MMLHNMLVALVCLAVASAKTLPENSVPKFSDKEQETSRLKKLDGFFDDLSDKVKSKTAADEPTTEDIPASPQVLYDGLYDGFVSDEKTMSKRSNGRIVQVEGCFKSFSHAIQKRLGNDNSNGACQKFCRDKGYIVAGTKGSYCYCGNIYPTGKETTGSECRERCVSWYPCHTPQSCCGGGNGRYTVSLVGDIDVARQILERLSHAWKTNTGLRNHIMSKFRVIRTVSNPSEHIGNWVHSFDKKGWSTCPTVDNAYTYMTAMERSVGTHDHRIETDLLYRLEHAKCRTPVTQDSAQDCVKANWWSTFDRKGWSKCDDGYFMTGLYRTDGNNLYNIEESRCCKPKQLPVKWGECKMADISTSFDKAGWSGCPKDYYMAGLYRGACEKLYCVEHLYCCKMNVPAYSPTLHITVKDVRDNRIKDCSITAIDATEFTCKETTQRHPDMVSLKALSFNMEDTSPLNLAQPRPIEGVQPVICSPHTEGYPCFFSHAVTLSKSSTIETQSGFSIGVDISAGVEVTASASVTASAGFVEATAGSSTTASFSSTVSTSHSQSTSRAISTAKQVTNTASATVPNPPNEQTTINLMRVKQDLEYRWKATYQVLGWFTVKRDDETFKLDTTVALTGDARKLYAFGKWRYPGTDFLKFIITNKFGRKEKNCPELKPGEKNKCEMSV